MLLIIIPTLNEEKNVKFLFDEIKKKKIKFHLLFVDDNSQDNTRKNILHLSEKYKNVFYIFRPRRLGIGSAHKDALKWAALTYVVSALAAIAQLTYLIMLYAGGGRRRD